MFKLSDKLAISGASQRDMTPEGFLNVSAQIARSGVYEYAAWELSPLFDDREPLSIVNVYRSADEVFAPQSMQSFQRKPVTDGHPWEPVDAGNVTQVQIGLSGETMSRVGDFVAGKLLIQAADAVVKVLAGSVELSAGYVCDVEREAGTFDGIAYDAVQRNIIGNHIALVDAGRCGALCRIGDRAPTGAKPKQATINTADCGCQGQPDMTTATAVAALQTIMHDGFALQMDANGAAALKKLQDKTAADAVELNTIRAQLAATTTAFNDAKATHAAEVEALKKQIPDAAMMDQLAQGRATVIADAKKILGDTFNPTGKSDAAIRREVVVSKMADQKDADDAFISAAFKTLVSLGGTQSGGGRQTQDSISQAVQQSGNGNGSQTMTRDQARQAHMDRLVKASQHPSN